MNDPHDFLAESGDDPLLEEILAHLKRLEPPLETRISNRMAVAAELNALLGENRKRRLPWWRRSISIPLPMAAALLVLAALVLPSSFRGGPDRSAKRAADTPRDERKIAKHAPEIHSVLEYHATETYLCGIGRVHSESRYFIKE